MKYCVNTTEYVKEEFGGNNADLNFKFYMRYVTWLCLNLAENKVLIESLTAVCKAKVAQEQQTVVQSSEQREAAAERIVPEEELEHGGLLVPAGPPVCVRHGELVQVRQ